MEQRVEHGDNMRSRFLKMKDIFMALFVRLLLFIHSVLAYWRVESTGRYGQSWWFLLLLVLQLLEAGYTVIRRKGVENEWFCVCYLCYLASIVPAIIMLEIDRLIRLDQGNKSQPGSLSTIPELNVHLTLNSQIWVSILEQLMLFLMVLGRLLLPRGKLSRDQLSQLLFVYIGMASDVTDLFQLFNERNVRKDKPLTYSIFAVWTVSLLLFTVVLTASMSPKKSRVAPSRNCGEGGETSRCAVLRMFFETEIWSIVLTFLFQDGPFLCVRLVAIIKHRLLNYTVIFFASKNVFVTLLLMYRLYVLCFAERPEPKQEDEQAPDRSCSETGSST
ncbi:transmembrane protein 26-like [Gigantopelta aegis]|uniref:transmembrane protein 26-like n=1 Tax=Gigantopelta aegis TaxID=1735272 RepID=UPI001B88B4CC|nr:transmembrane protein 26-like [Gigantopelta aegis]